MTLDMAGLVFIEKDFLALLATKEVLEITGNGNTDISHNYQIHEIC